MMPTEKPILESQIVEDIPPAVAVAAEAPKKDKGWGWMLAAFGLGVVVGTVTGYLVTKTPKLKNSKNQNTTVVQTSSTPSPSPAATDIKRADLKVQVLNGSGVAGAAVKAKTLLEGLGYVDVAVGNADGDFQLTEIAFKKTASKYTDMLAKDLETKYKLGPNIDLDESSDYDVVITLGAE